tara:strand:- start:423 stop:1250 length:828 start_codon:yes stop_codon:yes gene_type:complete
MATLLSVIGVIVFLFGVVTLIRPIPKLKVPTRARALLVIAVSFAITLPVGLFVDEPSPAKPYTVAVASAASEGFKISVKAKPVSAYEVEVKIKTNIPLPVEVMASVSIKGQNPQDIYIGTSKTIKLSAPEQTVILDGKDENLPAGEYYVEVAFYPEWGADDGPTEAKRINSEIIGQADVSLTGSGESKAQTDAKNDAKYDASEWAMENAGIGAPWNEDQFVAKLGPFKKSASELNLTAAPGFLFDAYYFEYVDMTIIVSRATKKVVIWRDGLATK